MTNTNTNKCDLCSGARHLHRKLIGLYISHQSFFYSKRLKPSSFVAVIVEPLPHLLSVAGLVTNSEPVASHQYRLHRWNRFGFASSPPLLRPPRHST